jgi:hypothetical protein
MLYFKFLLKIQNNSLIINTEHLLFYSSQLIGREDMEGGIIPLFEVFPLKKN